MIFRNKIKIGLQLEILGFDAKIENLRSTEKEVKKYVLT